MNIVLTRCTLSMAEDAVNAAIKSGKLSPTNNSLTHNLRLIGGDGWDPASFTVLAQQYVRMKKTQGGKVVPGVMDTAAAKHLSHAYGTLAERVAAIAQVGLSCSNLHFVALTLGRFPCIPFLYLFHDETKFVIVDIQFDYWHFLQHNIYA
jgi:hypothetical protein